MTRRARYVAFVVVLAAVAVVLVMLRDGTPGTLNVAESAGLRESTAMDILVPTDGAEEQWITITNRETVAELAGLLDETLPVEQAVDCPTLVTLRFFSNTGDERTIEYACDGAPVLRGADDFWGDGTVAAPAAFVAALEAQLSLLP